MVLSFYYLFIYLLLFFFIFLCYICSFLFLEIFSIKIVLIYIFKEVDIYQIYLKLYVTAGLCGPGTFVMCVIGVEMMMAVMVRPLCFPIFLSNLSCCISSTEVTMVLYFFVVQLCYFALESMKTVVHNQDIFELISKVSSFLSKATVKNQMLPLYRQFQ